VRADPISELGGLRALARSLVHGDSEAEDLLQDTAVAMLEHPPDAERPLRPWLVTVIMNRWRMDRRGASRRRARERAVEPEAVAQPIDALERAQTLRRLGEAVEALAGPYRDVVIARYFDGKTSVDIARELAIPAATVRTRLARALERLRAALDDSAPRKRWQRALIPIPLSQGGWLVKAKTQASLVMALIALLGGVVWFAWPREHATAPTTPAASASRAQLPAISRGPAEAAALAPVPAGQRRAVAEAANVAGGAASGRVINWSTGDGVAGAELTFASSAGAVTIKTRDDGSFELVGAAPGAYTLAMVAAGGFLPYSPEYLHSTVRFQLVSNQVVRDVAVFLFPALDYHGRVVDAAGKPVAGAKVTLVGTPTGEQTIDRTEAWTSDRDGRFTFHAADDAVLEATLGERRGWARLDGKVAISKQLVIPIAKVAARDATITGRVVDDEGKPLSDVLVRAEPDKEEMEKTAPHDSPPRATAFAVTGSDGAFALRGLDRGSYVLGAEAEDRAPAAKPGVMGGSRDVALVVTAGARVSGMVTRIDGKPVPSFTLLAYRRAGAERPIVSARSFVDARGHFELHLEPGKYELVASAQGWAPSPITPATAPSEQVGLKISAGGTITGKVTSAATGEPITYARVMLEAANGGASAQPANAGTVTARDGSFTLTGVPPGKAAITIGADAYDSKIEGGLEALDGASVGPLAIALAPLAPGAQPKIDLVGIGVKLAADGDDLLVQQVIANSGAQAAGIVEGDRITTVDGVPVTELGVGGAVAKIRGVANTTVSIGLRRGVVLVVTRTKIQA
jgi:RNA polymerase sigma-70 factor (ECF subfamily)